MSRFYNYDTRGASHASQIVWLESELERVREDNDKLRSAATYAWAVLSKMDSENAQIAADTLKFAIWKNICGND